MRILSLFLVMVLSISSWASLNQEQVLEAVKGRYQVSVDGGKVNFLIRSSGKLEVLGDRTVIGDSSIQFVNSESSWGMSGLPVVHITLLSGSDEDARDYHYLITVIESYRDKENEVKFITSFSTFNDGPNGYSELEAGALELLKYNKDSKKLEKVK